jgi:hypothetical protein
MPARKIRVELFDTEGNKYSISFEGQITRDKTLRLLDLVELLGGGTTSGMNPGNTPTTTRDVTKFDKIRSVIQKHFPIGWFSSKEIQNLYEQELKEPINLTTTATYLGRMTTRGTLQRTGPPNNLKYKLPSALSGPTLTQRIDTKE